MPISSAAIAPPNAAGRPRRKRDIIVAAANRLFLEHGFASTSMDAVAREAAISKATLYSYFDGKIELFAAVVQGSAEDYAGNVIENPGPDESLRESLTRIGSAISALLLAPETVAALRMVISEAARSPELGRIYFENGPLRLRTALECYFQAAIARGAMRPVQPAIAATQFVALIQGDLRLRAQLGVRTGTSLAEREAMLRAGVDLFCRAHALEETPA